VKLRADTLVALRLISSRMDNLETAVPPTADHDVVEELQILAHRIEAVKAAAAEQLAHDAGRVASELGDLREAVVGLTEWQKDITLAVSEGIERVDRSERRIQATVKRARKELAAEGIVDPGVEAEAHQLQLVDGDGGEPSPVPAVREQVAPASSEASSIKGVSLEQLRRARGV